MPEPYWPKHKHSYTLGDAMKNALYARIWCGYCKRSRYFLLEDLKRLFGNIECDMSSTSTPGTALAAKGPASCT